ncbi:MULTISPECIES: hypothetical protein [Sorangium]
MDGPPDLTIDLHAKTITCPARHVEVFEPGEQQLCPRACRSSPEMEN